MNILKSYKNDFFTINDLNFNQRALDLFYFQAQHNQVYNLYLKGLKKNPNLIRKIEEIPFLPIEFFKNHIVKTSIWNPVAIFESSGTTSDITSRHYIEDMDFYNSISLKIFNSIYGHPSDYHILALLPSYLERKNSSLISMVEFFIQESKSDHSGFYLNNYKDLIGKIKILQGGKRKIFLIGVTFALLDLAEAYETDLSDAIIMETGGMKGRREELIRKQVHEILKNKFNANTIHSEYGMTELLSQTYAIEEGKFESSSWIS